MESNREPEHEGEAAEDVENVSGGRKIKESNVPTIGEVEGGEEGVTGSGKTHDSPESKYRGSSLVRHRNMSFPVPSPADTIFTEDDYKEIYRVFPDATIIQESYPFCVIGGATPPESPVSVKGLITEFWDDIDEFQYVPCDLGTPALRDPMSSCIDSEEYPDCDDLNSYMDEIELALGIQLRSMAVYLHFVVFEVDEPDFDLNKLPGTVGGRIACWGIYGTVWNLDSAHTQRSKDPQTEGHDETEYTPDLQPGIKLCGEVQASSAGALLSKETTGEKVLTVAAHTFDLHNDNIVYHPDKPGRIGQLTTVDEEADWGFCTLDDGVNFTNTEYFGSPIPTHFLSINDARRKNRYDSWYCANGFTTGEVWMVLVGVYLQRDGNRHRTLHLTSRYSYILRHALGSAGEVTNVPRGGLCGAPVVYQKYADEVLSNRVIGFFYKSNLRESHVTAVDALMDQG